MKGIALSYETPDEKENITPDNRIFFKYIANGKYQDIENEICKLYELYFAENTDNDENDDEDTIRDKRLSRWREKDIFGK